MVLLGLFFGVGASSQCELFGVCTVSVPVPRYNRVATVVCGVYADLWLVLAFVSVPACAGDELVTFSRA